jgi:hypothetical protein
MMMWLRAHARCDEAHPDEALALELFASSIERSYDLGLG